MSEINENKEFKYWPDPSGLILALEREIEQKKQILEFEHIKYYFNVLMGLAPVGSVVKLGLLGGYIGSTIEVCYLNIQGPNREELMKRDPAQDDKNYEWDFRPIYISEQHRAVHGPMAQELLNEKIQPYLRRLAKSIYKTKGTDNGSRAELSLDYSITHQGGLIVMDYLLGNDREQFFINEEKNSISKVIPIDEKSKNLLKNSLIEIKNKI